MRFACCFRRLWMRRTGQAGRMSITAEQLHKAPAVSAIGKVYSRKTTKLLRAGRAVQYDCSRSDARQQRSLAPD
ncbi:hypothetical protein R70723_22635 [Paenibacillus sp. FSL R7-0273]|nr:hypothetical protein R70723_22635 [Paenibacillus sp. FSL R7-0273]OMF88453.1 hypothetical protein BK144_21685 [Paenibacillus sp. FSL R7-0273]